MSTVDLPIELDFKSADASAPSQALRTFTSYSFERTILTPAVPFRFSAPGVDIDTRLAIRSGDTVTLWASNSVGKRFQLATGFIDDTDTNISPENVDYSLTGRDTLGQLVDNAAVDANNVIQNVQDQTLVQLAGLLVQNTRMPQQVVHQQCPTGTLLFQTAGGETKINALQRYLEFTNCLAWSAPSGRLTVGKPNFAQANSGSFIVKAGGSNLSNNVLEVRVRRNVTLAIRKIVTQLQTFEQVNAGKFTIYNQDQDVSALASSLVGRSVYTVFSYGQGTDAVNKLKQVGNQNGSPNVLGAALSKREIARENMRVLDVEIVAQGHINESDLPYNIDQMYYVQVDDEEVSEDMYVYSVGYELTMEHGKITRIKLCRKGSICADSAIIAGGAT